MQNWVFRSTTSTVTCIYDLINTHCSDIQRCNKSTYKLSREEGRRKERNEGKEKGREAGRERGKRKKGEADVEGVTEGHPLWDIGQWLCTQGIGAGPCKQM